MTYSMIAKATSKIEIIPCASKTRESSNLGTVPNVNNPQKPIFKKLSIPEIKLMKKIKNIVPLIGLSYKTVPNQV